LTWVVKIAPMQNQISRRSFLKLGGVALSALAVNPFPPIPDDSSHPSGILGRVTRDTVSVFKEPTWPQGETIAYLRRDSLENLYYSLTPQDGPPYNPVWYRIWDGYIHSAYIQKVKYRYNTPVESLPESGQLVEVTVPYTQIYQYNLMDGWQRRSRLYYQSTHWGVGVDEGPDGTPWYRLYDELREDQYHVPASHMRIIPDEELSPISPDVPAYEKRMEVSIQDQTLLAYEGDRIVFSTHISSGINKRPDPNGVPWDTPRGQFNIQSKMPSKHMGVGDLAADGSDLPGVPWTCFFLIPPGNAFHGTYWHDNFGLQMSHGCVNMRTEEAKWLFRWSTPVFTTPIENHQDWEQRGMGTSVIIT
jgi:lipoprotein-anchoring transpeptidase ErfK/SrfK